MTSLISSCENNEYSNRQVGGQPRVSSQRLDSKRRAEQKDSAKESHEKGSITNFQSNAPENKKTEKLKDQISQSRTSTSPNYGLA